MIYKGQGKITKIEVAHHTSPNYNCSNGDRIIVRWYEEKPPNNSYYYNFKVVESEEQLAALLVELSRYLVRT